MTTIHPVRRALDLIRSFTGWTIIGGWLVSLPLEVESTQANHPVPGYRVALEGWVGPAFGYFAWYANIGIIWIAICLLGRRRFGLVLGIVGGLTLLLAASTLSWSSVPTGMSNSGTPIQEFGPGFYLWLLVAIIAGCSALLLYLVDLAQGDPQRSSSRPSTKA